MEKSILQECAFESPVNNSEKINELLEMSYELTIDDLSNYSSCMTCPKGMEIIIGGLEEKSLYYLKKGVVEVSYRSGDTKIVVALIGENSFFGESGFFDGESRVRDIRAIEDAEVLVFDFLNIMKMRDENPLLFGNMMAFMARSISGKFRRILEERDPLAGYAASLSTGARSSKKDVNVPEYFMDSDEGKIIKRPLDEFKSRLFDLSLKLQKEVGRNVSFSINREYMELLDEFNGHLESINTLGFESDLENCVWEYVFKEAYPYFMRSRLAERAYFKPKGYAGDFLMIEMLYNNNPDGDGKIGKIIDSWCLNSPAGKAVRNRRKLLSRNIENLAAPKISKGKIVHIMNLACGPSRELFDFIYRSETSDVIRATCVDIDSDALEYTDRNAKAFFHDASVLLMRENLIKWATGKVNHDFGMQDIIYSSGLMDYLNNNLFTAMANRCYDNLKPGGTLMLGNFSTKNPIRMFMDHILDWKLIHRNESDLKELFFDTPFGRNVKVISEEEGVNLFAVATKV